MILVQIARWKIEDGDYRPAIVVLLLGTRCYWGRSGYTLKIRPAGRSLLVLRGR